MNNISPRDLKIVKERINSFQKKFGVTDTANFMQTELQSSYQSIMQNANLLNEHIFVFQKPLDMEPCSIPFKNEPLDWVNTPNGDPEWLFMLHRKEYLFDLVVAYLTTHNPVYLHTWKTIVFDWIDNHPLNVDTKSIGWRTIDTGIRCYHWCRSLLFILPLNVLTKEEVEKIIQSLREQLQHIYNAYIPKHDLSNWGILQVAGVLVCESWLSEVLQTDLKEWAIRKLKVQLNLQVNRNGVHWEQSPLYQFESLYYMVAAVHHATLANVSLDNSFIDGIRALSQSSIYQMQPDGKLIAQSDTDLINANYVLQYAEIVLGEKVLPSDQRTCGESTLLWLVGYNRYEAAMSQDCEQFEPQLDAWDELTGNSWSRNNWTDKADYVSVHCGPVSSGHGHLDLGHFNYVYQGIPIYVDSGRYSYTNGPVRTHLKSAHAHNTLLVDGETFSSPKDSWTYNETADPLAFNAWSYNDIHLTETIYNACLSDGVFYTVRRRVVFVKALSSVVISDFVIAKGKHRTTRLFHVAPDVIVNHEADQCLRLKTKAGDVTQYFFGNTDTMVRMSFVSPVYNELRNASVIQASDTFTNQGSFLTVIAPSDVNVFKDKVSQSGTNRVVDSLYMEALVLKKGDTTKTILHGQKDTVHGHKLYHYKGTPFYGRINIMDSDGSINRLL